MRKVVKSVCNALAGAATGFSSALVLTAIPMAGIRRTFPTQMPELIALYLFASTWAIVLARLFTCDPQLRKSLLHLNEEPKPAQETEKMALARHVMWLSGRLPALAGLLFFFLYCASIALCQRLHLLLITQTGLIPYDVVRVLGIAVLAAGCGLQVKVVLTSFGATQMDCRGFCPSSNFHLRHPILLGWLLVLVGMPLAFGVWMPLAGIPGIYIVLRSWVGEQEEHLKEAARG